MSRIRALFSSGSAKIMSRGKIILGMVTILIEFLQKVYKLLELVQKVFNLVDKLLS